MCVKLYTPVLAAGNNTKKKKLKAVLLGRHFFITCWLADHQMIKDSPFSIYVWIGGRRRQKGAENVGSSIEAKAKKMQLYKMRERSHLFFCGLLSCPPFNFPFVMCLYKKGPIDGLGQRGVENKTQTFIEKIAEFAGQSHLWKRLPAFIA